MADDTPRISVSRDALRADLAEMELRLRTYFDLQLAQKANLAEVQRLQIEAAAFGRGEFTPAQKRAIEDMALGVQRETEGAGWTRRERLFTTVAIFVTVLTLLLSAYLAFHASGSAQPRGTAAAWTTTDI